MDANDIRLSAMETFSRLLNEAREARQLVDSLRAALGTEEEGEALVEVARAAHRAEQRLAARERRRDEEAPMEVEDEAASAPATRQPIVVDIGQAAQTLEASPELAAHMMMMLTDTLSDEDVRVLAVARGLLPSEQL